VNDTEPDDLEQAVQQTLSRVEPTGGSDYDARRKESVQMFEKKIRTVRWLTGFFLAIDIAAGVAAAVFLQYATSTQMMIWSAIMFMVAFESTILIKLWYWVMTSKLSVLRELKQLELQLAGQRKEEKQ
jgi:uncharacterized protein (DUF58 family)